jgi:hypothetical protein
VLVEVACSVGEILLGKLNLKTAEPDRDRLGRFWR